ncbi:hypothetical protein HY573_01095 [Candidatus Parcubacteria bacterium]|nr:hypothetical protein [Candidatus Parcubacteria bacterium]
MYSIAEDEGSYIYRTKNHWLWWAVGGVPVILSFGLLGLGRSFSAEWRASYLIVVMATLAAALGAYAVGGFEVWWRALVAVLRGKRITVRRIGWGCERRVEK